MQPSRLDLESSASLLKGSRRKFGSLLKSRCVFCEIGNLVHEFVRESVVFSRIASEFATVLTSIIGQVFPKSRKFHITAYKCLGSTKTPKIGVHHGFDNFTSFQRIEGDVSDWLEALDAKLKESKKKKPRGGKRGGKKADDDQAATVAAAEDTPEEDQCLVSEVMEWNKKTPEQKRKIMEDWINSELDLYEKDKGHKMSDEERAKFLQYEPPWVSFKFVFASREFFRESRTNSRIFSFLHRNTNLVNPSKMKQMTSCSSPPRPLLLKRRGPRRRSWNPGSRTSTSLPLWEGRGSSWRNLLLLPCVKQQGLTNGSI